MFGYNHSILYWYNAYISLDTLKMGFDFGSKVEI